MIDLGGRRTSVLSEDLYIYICMPWEGHQAYMRSGDADKEPTRKFGVNLTG